MNQGENISNKVGKYFTIKSCRRLAILSCILLANGSNFAGISISSATSNITQGPYLNGDVTIDMKGKNGTSVWKLYSNGELHIEAGTLDSGQIVSEKRGQEPDAPVEGLNNEVAAKTKTIIFDGDVHANKDSHGLFANLNNLTSISNIDCLVTDQVENMDNIFQNDEKLTKLDLNSWDVSNVNSMYQAFENTGINSLDIGTWNVSKVKNMGQMFMKSKITSIDLSHWDTSSVETMDSMFSEMPLETIDIKNWNVSNVSDMSYMFSNTQLDVLDLSKWKCNNFTKTTMMLSDSPIRILKVSDSVSLQRAGLAPSINEVNIAGTNKNPDIQFISDKWLEIGNGTIEDPAGKKEYTANEIEDSHTGEQKHSGAYVRQNTSLTEGEQISFDVIIQTNLPERVVKITNVKGKVGDKIKATVPTFDGYTHDKKFVIVKVTTNAIIVENVNNSGFVTYTKIATPNNPNSVKPSNPIGKPIIVKPADNVVINNVKRVISTHYHKGIVKLLNKNLQSTSSRSLLNATDWLSDKEMIKNGAKYYRVSSEEWIKETDAYEYISENKVIKTKPNANVEMVNSEGKVVENRVLAKNTTWKSDRKIKINGQEYYRVSINEFVASVDVTVI